MTMTSWTVSMILFSCLAYIKPIETISCYTCIDCPEPFDSTSPNVSQSLSSCYYCYKFTVFMAYAPTYSIRECVQTCVATYGVFGGSSLEVNCCTSSLCNDALGVYFQYTWKDRLLFTIIPSLSVIVFVHNMKK